MLYFNLRGCSPDIVLGTGSFILAASGFMGANAYAAGKTEYSGFIENNTIHRESRGLSKIRNTAQLEFTKLLGVGGPSPRYP
ncbi:MAG: hypothetical protein VW985_09025 [Gammaproteobacteria bacterium]